MAIYALWNNKGGVGKSYLTFQIASEYARTHPTEKILVIDACPQANASSMLLGGIVAGEDALAALTSRANKPTIAGYIEERVRSPYVSPKSGSKYFVRVYDFNPEIPSNLYLVVGDEGLETQASRVANATNPGPQEAWRIVHAWLNDLIADIRQSWNVTDSTVFIDCNPSFTIYTELAMSTANRLIIPFSADGSSKRAVRAVLLLLYGVTRVKGQEVSDFFTKSQQYTMKTPLIYCYVGNRLTQMNYAAAKAYKTVVDEIGNEIFAVWRTNPNLFYIHPSTSPPPRNRQDFQRMYQAEINDANTASVVSGGMGIPIGRLTPGSKIFARRRVTVNETQLARQAPNMRRFVATIE